MAEHNSDQHGHGGTATLDHNDSVGSIVTGKSTESDSHNESKGSSIHQEELGKSLENIDNGDGTFTHTHEDGTVESHANEGGDSDHDHPVENPTSSGISENYTQHNGTTGSDRLFGGAGDDFIFPGEGSFRFNTAVNGEEFPFATDSNAETEINLSLDQEGNFKVQGETTGLDGAPLFSQGETELDPNNVVLNGADPQALVDGFLSVKEDADGNTTSGTHLHFSPSGDDRGDFADATVVRFFDNEVSDDGRSATIDGNFKLNPVEQASLLAGNLYANLHTNVDVDGDGKAGFATGETRTNFNQNVVEFV